MWHCFEGYPMHVVFWQSKLMKMLCLHTGMTVTFLGLFQEHLDNNFPLPAVPLLHINKTISFNFALHSPQLHVICSSGSCVDFPFPVSHSNTVSSRLICVFHYK